MSSPDTIEAAVDALRGTFSTGQVARKFKTTDHQVREWIRQGHLRAVRTPSGRYRVRPQDLAALFEVVNADAVNAEGGAR